MDELDDARMFVKGDVDVEETQDPVRPDVFQTDTCLP